MRILIAAVLYFLLAFGAGFGLGIVRVLWLVPQVGDRAGELMEMPVMLVVIFFAARWVVRRFRLPRGPGPRLGAGFAALGLLVCTEWAGVLWIRGLTLNQYLRGRDPVAGTAYLAMLAIFAMMPLWVARR